jgi:HSP20 family protein
MKLAMYFEFQQDARRVTNWAPAVDVCERETEIVILVEMPGVDRGDVQLSWKNGVLVITGQKRQRPSDRGVARYLRVERAYGHFRREIAITTGIDQANAHAELRDGLMTIRLPKAMNRPELSRIPIL